jgi:methionyl aminopeptidase
MERTLRLAHEGCSLTKLDQFVGSLIEKQGGIPCFNGYLDYPANACMSVNDVAVHGIPNGYKLKRGDLLTIDMGVSVDGWNVDAARSILVGQYREEGYSIVADSKAEQLIARTQHLCEEIVDTIESGVTLDVLADIGKLIADRNSLNVMTQFTGHGIGKSIHQKPSIHHSYPKGLSGVAYECLREKYALTKLTAGDIICVEPVCTFGKTETTIDEDGWTIRTKDGSLACHHEHTVLVTEKGAEILC